MDKHKLLARLLRGFVVTLVIAPIFGAGIAIFTFDWRSFNWIDWLVFSLTVIWYIGSWSNTVNPDFIAFRQWFGYVERRTLRPGPHFVPWFPGIRLRRMYVGMHQFTYQADPNSNKPSYERSGDQIAVRSFDRQKMHTDSTFFFRVPLEDEDQLIHIIESGVPIDDVVELKRWVENGFSTHMLSVFGKHPFDKVIGGKMNEELSKDVNELLQKPDSLFVRCGLFDKSATTFNLEGTGEAYLRIEYVHVSEDLGKRLEEVETSRIGEEANMAAAEVRVKTSKLDADAALNVAMGNAHLVGGVVEIALDQWVAGEAKRMGKTVAEAAALLKKSGAYEWKETALHKLQSQALAGGGTFTRTEQDLNIHSGGEPLGDSNIAGFIGAAGGAAMAIAAAMKGSRADPSGGGSGQGQNPSGTRNKNKKKKNESDEDFKKRYGG